VSNIQLKSLTKKFGSDSVTQLDDLSTVKDTTNFLYKDLRLDLTDVTTTSVYKSNSINSTPTTKDLAASLDEEAITNSIKNWFRTAQYTRLLNPDLKMDFRSYMFERCDSYTAYFLGMMLNQTLPALEPRINIETCTITVDTDNDCFIIELVITIPTLNNKEIKLKEILESSGYTTL
jgi:phage baseplate assembly protein W